MKLGILEGLLFVTGEDGLTVDEISKLLEIEKEETMKLIDEYSSKLKEIDRGLKLNLFR